MEVSEHCLDGDPVRVKAKQDQVRTLLPRPHEQILYRFRLLDETHTGQLAELQSQTSPTNAS